MRPFKLKKLIVALLLFSLSFAQVKGKEFDELVEAELENFCYQKIKSNSSPKSCDYSALSFSSPSTEFLNTLKTVNLRNLPGATKGIFGDNDGRLIISTYSKLHKCPRKRQKQLREPLPKIVMPKLHAI